MLAFKKIWRCRQNYNGNMESQQHERGESSMQWNMKQVNYTLTSLANRNGLEFDTFSQKIMFSMQDPKTKNSWCQNREGYSKSNTCVQFINDQIVWPRIQGQSFNTMITIIYVNKRLMSFMIIFNLKLRGHKMCCVLWLGTGISTLEIVRKKT